MQWLSHTKFNEIEKEKIFKLIRETISLIKIASGWKEVERH